MGKKGIGDKKDDWGTPRTVFELLDKEFNFNLDPCGRSDRTLKKNMKTLDIREGYDGLKFDWGGYRVFVNPPYSNHNIREWVKKAYSSRDKSEVIVMIIPPNVETSYLHDFIYHIAEIRFPRGRIQFVNFDGLPSKSGNPQASMFVIYRKKSD